MNKHKWKDAKFIFWKVLLEFPYVYFNKAFGFHLPPREVVHRNINQLPSIRKLQVSICDWERLTVFSKSMRCEAQIARFWLLRLRVSQSLRAHSQTRKHWGRECGIAKIWLFGPHSACSLIQPKSFASFISASSRSVVLLRY